MRIHGEQVLDRPFWETPWWRGSEEVKARVRAATEQAAGMVFREELPYWWATARSAGGTRHPPDSRSGRPRYVAASDRLDIQRRAVKIARLRPRSRRRARWPRKPRARRTFLALVSHGSLAIERHPRLYADAALWPGGQRGFNKALLASSNAAQRRSFRSSKTCSIRRASSRASCGSSRVW